MTNCGQYQRDEGEIYQWAIDVEGYLNNPEKTLLP